MKKCLLAVVASLAVCFMANAKEPYMSFGTIGVSYSPMTMNVSYSGLSTGVKFNGIGVNFTNANSIARTPLYVEYGLSAQFSFSNPNNDLKKITDGLVNIKANALSFKVPVELLYKIDFGSSIVSLAPYAGVDATVYAFGKVSAKDVSESFDVFSDNVLDVKMNRFNLDWHVGAKLFISDFFVGVAYEAPIIGLYTKDNIKVNTNQLNISLGYMF